jgi:hypothetical protein
MRGFYGSENVDCGLLGCAPSDMHKWGAEQLKGTTVEA